MHKSTFKILPICLGVLLSGCLGSGSDSSTVTAPLQANAAAVPPFALGDMLELTIEQTQTAMKNRQLNCVQLVEGYLDRIQRLDRAVIDGNRLNSILRIAPNARKEAAALDELQAKGGWAGPLHCVPTLPKTTMTQPTFRQLRPPNRLMACNLSVMHLRFKNCGRQVR